jgi:hypothetical protein
MVVVAVVAVPALLQVSSSPAEALQAKRNILPAFEAEAFRDPDFPDSEGDLPMPSDCGSKNITGQFNFSRWTVKSSIGPGSTVWVGDEWTVTFSIGQTYAGGPYGNNGPDPLTLELKPGGPVEAAAAPTGEINKLFNVYAYDGGNSNVGLHTAIGAWGYSFDSNSSPGVFELSDGANVKLITKMKANAAGIVTLPKIHIGGHDGTTPAGPVSCDFNVGWSWNVATPLSPVAMSDTAKVNASYTKFVIEDATSGSHRIRIPVLANDDDPNINGGPGDTNQVGIADWSAKSVHNGDVKCGTIKNAAASTPFADLGHSCEYQPAQGYAGPDTFNYKVRQKSDGLEKVTAVNVNVLPNTAPTAADAHFATDQGEDKTFDLEPYGDDPENDPLTCTPDLYADPFPAVGTVTIHPDCTFDWNNTSPAFSGDVAFEYLMCDLHPTLTMAQMGNGITKLSGFSTGDLDGNTTRRCKKADVTITVKSLGLAVVLPPKANTDVDVVDAGYAADGIGKYTVAIDVLANDTDSNGPKPSMPSAKVAVKTAPDPSEGTAVAKADGTIEFTPANGFSGPVSFTYQVCEDPAQQNPVYQGAGMCSTGLVKVNVLGNEAPVANDDTWDIVATDTIVNDSLAANDSEPELDIISCKTTPVDVSDPAKVESLQIGANCSFSFDPVDSATGLVDVQYAICDSHELAFPLWPKVPYGTDGRSPGQAANRCSVGTATVNLTAPPDDQPEVRDREPVCADDEAHTAHGTPIVIDVLANDSDVDPQGDPSPLYVPGPTADEPMPTKNGASIQLAADPTKLQYTPDANFAGDDFFDYLAFDTAGQSCMAHVKVIVDPIGNETTTTTTPGNETTTTTAPGGDGSTTTTAPGDGSTTTVPGDGNGTTTVPGGNGNGNGNGNGSGNGNGNGNGSGSVGGATQTPGGSGSTTGNLPLTGSDSLPLVAVGLGLVLVGALAVRVARRGAVQ